MMMLLYFLGSVKGTPYWSLGCWKSKGDYSIESKLGGDYKTRTDPIRKCYKAAKATYIEYGATVFSIYDGGKCLMNKYSFRSYHRYGMSSSCGTNGTGGPRAHNVYIIMGEYFEFGL